MELQTQNTGKYSSTLSKQTPLIILFHSVTAKFLDGDQIVAQHTLETCFRVTSRGAKAKNLKPTRMDADNLDSARSSEDQIQSVFRLLFPICDC